MRSFGLIFVYGAIDRLWAVVQNFSIAWRFTEIEWELVLTAFLSLCVAVLFLRAVNSIVSFAYPASLAGKK